MRLVRGREVHDVERTYSIRCYVRARQQQRSDPRAAHTADVRHNVVAINSQRRRKTPAHQFLKPGIVGDWRFEAGFPKLLSRSGYSAAHIRIMIFRGKIESAANPSTFPYGEYLEM